MWESTPLLEALSNSNRRIPGHCVHLEVALVLLEHGTDVSAANRHGDTLLHIAAWKSCWFNEVGPMLLQLGSVASAKNNLGNTPLHVAAISANIRGVERLLAYGADVSVRNNEGMTPLWCVADQNGKDNSFVSGWHPAVIQILLGKGADINAKDNTMKTPLMAAARWGDPKIVQVLVKQGADVTPEDLASAEVRARTAQEKHDQEEVTLLVSGTKLLKRSPVRFARR
jgi:ankyrin repeat protein